ncbi:uncharacterized protein PHALS_02417 [Plasmopara halstedii]|uniref:Uncharacterized protein n=1 Tax=Plasmopara halstedii TaxID=4781 RepID=A0A0P1A846_PLAHL|nr:uncharacterized protein PHALS_02417 [Plasmopara halstedii]CEG36327.1 hypothetical protein PHALS_02417 [Plasmopara halstedii]|eukprot:XP_024572696.1 hypothetical protein PHALS_02417 [Plasmopara halstedii]
MIDEEVTQSLEQEAIALVNLSNPIRLTSTNNKLVAPVSGDTANQAQSASVELLDGSISMKSLLVMIKKRKLENSDVQVKLEESIEPICSESTSESPDDARLPSFRTIFHSSPQETEKCVPSFIKCKYRTGKCHNMRALKSCGDYHNLCNYHRLRANANQRKLDRKKKEQRLQQQYHSATALSPPLALVPQSSSHAAAAALASLVAARPQYHLNVFQQQRPIFAVQEVSKNRCTSVRPKEEDACSY